MTGRVCVTECVRESLCVCEDENKYNLKLVPVNISIYLDTPDFHSINEANASLKLNLLSN